MATFAYELLTRWLCQTAEPISHQGQLMNQGHQRSTLPSLLTLHVSYPKCLFELVDIGTSEPSIGIEE